MKRNRGISLIIVIIIIILLLVILSATIFIIKYINNSSKSDVNNNSMFYSTDEKTKKETGKNEDENVSNEWSATYKTTEKNNYTDKSGKKATIPVGFQTSLKDGETEIDTGLVIRNAKDKNEFVWIPVDNINDYKRVEFSSGEAISSIKENGKQNTYYCIEELPEDEKISVNTYNGYYIGRYEAGIDGSQARTKANTKATANEIQEESGVILSQKGKLVYNYVTKDQAKGLSEFLYKKSKDHITSKLCSSYAWDTALNFISKNNSTYLTNSKEGNYVNTSFQYLDVDGKTKLKESNYPLLIPTGQTTSLNNIYDLGGNAWEFTTESYNWEKYPVVARGGKYTNRSGTYCASYRITGQLLSCGADYSFRITLYL